MSLRDALAAARRLAALTDREPGAFFRWTPPQREFYEQPGRRIAFRAGNQVGKTVVGLHWLIDHALGTHPLCWRPPPLECWIVCTSWAQSVSVMRKFHGLCPSRHVDPERSSRFSVRAGYGKDNPAVVLRNGSVVRFRTTRQGPEALQGATVHLVLIDEPTDLDIYRELDRRLTRTGGRLAITFTPANRDCSWLRDLVTAEVVREVHAKLTVENLTPTGAVGPLCTDDGTPMDAAWIADQWRTTPPQYAGVVLDGEWEARPEGVFFRCFDRARHLTQGAALDPVRGPIRWALGIDYAAAPREFGQTAVLLQVQAGRDAKGKPREAVLVHDVLVMPGVASNMQFAVDLLAMLGRHGLRWRDLDDVHGDLPVASRWVERSNVETARALAREIGVSPSALQPRILAAKEGPASAGALDRGCRYLYEHLADGSLLLHARCEALAQALETWDYRRDHPAKDRIDALRYALKPWIFPRGRAGGTIVRVA